jgi:hypothetical protein
VSPNLVGSGNVLIGELSTMGNDDQEAKDGVSIHSSICA